MDFFCIKSNKLEMQINFAHILTKTSQSNNLIYRIYFYNSDCSRSVFGRFKLCFFLPFYLAKFKLS